MKQGVQKGNRSVHLGFLCGSANFLVLLPIILHGMMFGNFCCAEEIEKMKVTTQFYNN